MAVKGMEGPFLNLFSRKITVDLLTCLYVQLYFRYLIIYISISDQNAIYNRLRIDKGSCGGALYFDR